MADVDSSKLKPCPFCGGKAHAIAENAAKRQPEVVMCLACLGEIEGAGAIDKWNARTLSAQSPAGVDGLNTDRNAAFKACPESGCDWGSFYLGWKARGVVEQAIIDGLRGEADQQAQRIGELASHLEFAVTMLTVAGLAGNAQVEAMRAALAAGVGGGK